MQRRQGAIEVAAAIAEAITLRIEADHRRQQQVRRHALPGVGDRDVPHAEHHLAAGRPGAEFQRVAWLDHHRQGHTPARRHHPAHQRAQVRLAAERPVEGDGPVDRHGDRLEAGDDALRPRVARCIWNGDTRGDELRALLLAPGEGFFTGHG
jgi:hypothetical protein